MVVSEPVAATLEELELNGCALILVNDPGETWADVFIAFRVFLKRLRRFEVNEDLTYVHWVLAEGYPLAEPDQETLRKDRVELNALWESLG